MPKKKTQKGGLSWFFVLAIVAASAFFYFSLSKSIAETVKTEIKIYFLRGEKLVVVKRGISLQTSASVIKKTENAMRYLLKGPPPTERILGVFSEISNDIQVLSLRQTGKTLRLNLSQEFLEYGGGSASIQAAIAQIVYTLTELETIDRVKFLINGKEDGLVLGGEGLVIERALRRSDVNL